MGCERVRRSDQENDFLAKTHDEPLLAILVRKIDIYQTVQTWVCLRHSNLGVRFVQRSFSQ